MYERKAGRAYLRGCRTSLVAAAGGALLGVALLATVLLLIRGGDVEPRSLRFGLALAAPALLVAALLTAAALFVRIRARRLDRAFAPWGLRGRQAGPVIRSWHGELDGRAFNAWFTRGPTLELYLACRPATRGLIHRGGPLIRALGRAVESRQPLLPSPLELAGASVYADDPAWMRRWVGRPETGSALAELMAESPRVATVVSVAPGAVRYVRRFLPVGELDADNLGRWVDQLGILATAADAVGSSTDGLEPSRLEEWARTSRDRYLNRIFLALALVLLLAFGGLFVFGWLFVGQS